MTAMHWARTASMLLRQPLMAGIISGNTTTDMSGRGIGSPSSKGRLIRRINGPARRSTAPDGPIGTQSRMASIAQQFPSDGPPNVEGNQDETQRVGSMP